MFLVLLQFCTVISFYTVNGVRNDDVIVDDTADMFYNDYDKILSEDDMQSRKDEKILSELSDNLTGEGDLEAVSNWNPNNIRNDDNGYKQFHRNHVSKKEHKEKQSRRNFDIHNHERQRKKPIHNHYRSWDDDNDKHKKLPNDRRARLYSRLTAVTEKRKRDENYDSPIYCWYQMKHETRKTCYGEVCVDVTITKFIQECITI